MIDKYDYSILVEKDAGVEKHSILNINALSNFNFVKIIVA